MGTFLSSSLLILSRDRKQLFVILLMPFFLSAILGFALRSNAEVIHMKVAVVQKDDEARGIERFVQELEQRSLSAERVDELRGAASTFRPSTILQNLLSDEEFRKMVDSIEMDASTAQTALKNKEITAILTIPENFTYLFLQKRLFHEGQGSELRLTIGDYTSLRAKIFHDIIAGFVRSINFETAIAQASQEHGLSTQVPRNENAISELGGLETVERREPVNFLQYYTLALAVLYVLVMASFMADKAFSEKQQHVFSRILLSGKHPLAYLGGKVFSTALIAFVQLLLLFSLSALIFQTFPNQTPIFWSGLVYISALFAICAGTMAALLIAISFRFENSAVIGLFSSVIALALAILGGSFIPSSVLPGFINQIGAWTPNGAALSAYIQWLQGLGREALFSPSGRLIGTTEETIRTYIRAKKLIAYRVGRDYKILKEDYDRFLEERRTTRDTDTEDTRD